MELTLAELAKELKTIPERLNSNVPLTPLNSPLIPLNSPKIKRI